MNLNAGLNNLLNKEKNIKKEILNKNITKIVNLILSNQPLITPNLKIERNLINRMSLYKKGYSLKNKNAKKEKICSALFKERFSSRDLSIINIENKSNININIPNISFKKIQNRNNHSFYILKKQKKNNLNNNDIPNNKISHQKSKIDLISQYKTESISKIKKARSFSTSRNSNYMVRLWGNKKVARRDFSSNDQQKNKNKKKINWTSNKPNKQNNFYLIKKQISFNHNLRSKINHYVEKLKKKSQREISKGKYYSFLIRNSILKKNEDKLFSYDSLKKRKKLEKNITFGNITTNNSDKENTNVSTKKNNINNITTNSNSNNIHCYTTNFNNSTNITETNDDIIIKKNIKKKAGLPFHPNSKKEFAQCQNESKKFLIRNNKSEINIPYNKKKTFPKIKRENSGYTFKLTNLKLKRHKEKMKITKTAREKDKNYLNLNENKNFITCFDDLNMNFNSIGSQNKDSFRDNVINDMGKEKNRIKSKNKKIEFSEGIEMNHFRIVAIIQENKKLLKESENCI